MAEGLDFSDIPLICDLQSDLDSTSELLGNSGNSQSPTPKRNSGQNLLNEDENIQGSRNSSQESSGCGINSSQGTNDSVTQEVTEAEDKNQDNEEKGEEYPGRIRTEEEMVLREFDLLDEVGPFDENEKSNNFCDDEDEDDDDDDDCDDLLEDEIDAMLEERLAQPPNKKPRLEKPLESSNNNALENENKTEDGADEDYVKREKIIMVEKVKNHFEVLPDGWVALTHNSGMPLYLHRASRVCTLSKPYSLGTGSARKHAIPLSAVPCLEYRRAKEEEEKRKNNEQEKPVIVVNGSREITHLYYNKAPEHFVQDYVAGGKPTDRFVQAKYFTWVACRSSPPVKVEGTAQISHFKDISTEIPNARIETAQENESNRQLTPEQLTEYCKSLFDFETIQVMKFKSWLGRRQYKKKIEKTQERPTLPKDTKLITCLIKQSGGCGKSGNTREWIMNPNGKSYVCILHEYVQRVLKDQPVYTFKELENTATPYLATVSIGNIQYGTGFGSSKKQAKHDAAKATLEILIPEMKEKIDQDEKLRGHAGNNRRNTDLSFFDGIKIEDPRVTELCAKTTEPLPHEILLTCLQRNFGLSQMNIKYETTPIKHCKNEFTMTVGNHTAKVICRNKRDGKQKASQAILQALHPHVPSWGSLLRLYGNTSVKTVKEKKIEEQEITLLQNRGNSHSPNYAILNKLKEEMKKFKAMKSAIKPIGKFVPPDDVDLPSESGSDLSNVLI